jgi:hypothetical protein
MKFPALAIAFLFAAGILVGGILAPTLPHAVAAILHTGFAMAGGLRLQQIPGCGETVIGHLPRREFVVDIGIEGEGSRSTSSSAPTAAMLC